MKYDNIKQATFLSRPNRFVAEVNIDGRQETVHVKNTGRCRELLRPGAQVWLTKPGTPGRKTAYDLVAVRKESGLLVNMDSQAPNKAAAEWLAGQGFDLIKPEYTYGESRIDFYMEGGAAASAGAASDSDGPAALAAAPFAPQGGTTSGPKGGPGLISGTPRCLMEVKGCTLEIDGVGYFPDAPTDRGVKHIRELIRARREGYRAVLAFVIQMEGIREVRPNGKTHPAFAEAWEEALAEGVEMRFLLCHVEPDGLWVTEDRVAEGSGGRRR